ncbi:MAG: hypothetical protein H6754_07260 [Candidatus Omnitrophica bacterium]|nr:hypothetical protein [Candidatus Omnitrophota bacterium]
MRLREKKRIWSVLILVPVAFLFLSCCCFKAEAAVVKKSNCAACPQKDTSNHQAQCPHKQIKAVVDSHTFDETVLKQSFIPIPSMVENRLTSPQFKNKFTLHFDNPQNYSSLYPQNPILRL